MKTQLHAIGDACEALGIGRTRLYEEIRSGRLRTVKVGRRRLIPAQALIDWITELEREQTR